MELGFIFGGPGRAVEANACDATRREGSYLGLAAGLESADGRALYTRDTIAAARYDVCGLDGVAGGPDARLPASVLSRAARAGRFDDVRALFPRVGDRTRAGAAVAVLALEAPGAEVLAWLSEHRVFAPRVTEAAAARGLLAEVMPLVQAFPEAAPAVVRSIARGVSRRGLDAVCELLAMLAPAEQESAAVAAAQAMRSDHPRFAAFVHGKRARTELRAAGLQGRAQAGEAPALEEARAARGSDRFAFVTAAFFGYLQGGHLALGERCLAVTDASQLTLRRGLLAGAAAARGDLPTAERLIEPLRAGARVDAADAVVRALGGAGQWERADAFARRAHKKASPFDAPYLAWGRAGLGEVASVEALIAWASPRDRGWTLEAAALGARRVDLWSAAPYP